MTSFDIAILIAGFSMFLIPVAGIITIILASRKKKSWKSALWVTIWITMVFLTYLCLCKYVREYFEAPYRLFSTSFLFLLILFAPGQYRKAKQAQKLAAGLNKDDILTEERERVVKTQIVDSASNATSKVNTGDAVGRALVGGALFGGLGAAVGAVTAQRDIKENRKVTFLVYYKDGYKNLRTVDYDSELYHLFMSRLDVK